MTGREWLLVLVVVLIIFYAASIDTHNKDTYSTSVSQLVDTRTINAVDGKLIIYREVNDKWGIIYSIYKAAPSKDEVRSGLILAPEHAGVGIGIKVVF